MTLHVKVKPGSKVDQLFYAAASPDQERTGHAWPGQERLLTAKIKAPAQDGKANAYLIELLAKQLGIAKSSITIVSGFTNSHKRLEIDVSPATYEAFLERIP